MHKLLALDQSSRCSGWAYFEDDKLVKHGRIIAEQEDVGERLYYIRQELIKLIDKYEVDEVAFEDIQYQSMVNGRSVNAAQSVKVFKMLAEVFGIVYELLTELKIPHTAVLAGTWKSKLDIKGQRRDEQKRNAQKYVIENYKIKPTQDECDAICIGTYIIKSNITIENDHDWAD